MDINNSSVVMKYFVNDKYRLLYCLLATKGAACRELYVCYFDFSVRNRATRARHMCVISTFPFVNRGYEGPASG
jgi:hypothetical protein